MGLILIGSLLFVLLLPGILFLISDLALRVEGSNPNRPPAPEPEIPDTVADRPSFLVLVPAHNEENVIGDCLESLARLDYPSSAFRIVVVADNCTDRTADIVRNTQADCFERENPAKRGKPYALAWTIDRLEVGEWDYTVVIDADTTVAPGFVTALAEAVQAGGTTHFQAYYGLSNTDETWLTRLSQLLVEVRYEVLFPRKERAGINCPLTGNGMCFRTDVFRDEGWPFFSLTENWEAFARLTAAGERIGFVPDARIYAEETTSTGESSTRRQRWLAGRYGVLVRSALPLLRSKHISWLQKIDALSELLYPGPVLHGDFVAIAVLISLIALPLPWAAGVAVLGTLTVLPVVAPAMSIAWRSGRLVSVLKSAGMLPMYAIWRAGIALATGLRALTGIEWEKTERKNLSADSD